MKHAGWRTGDVTGGDVTTPMVTSLMETSWVNVTATGGGDVSFDGAGGDVTGG